MTALLDARPRQPPVRPVACWSSQDRAEELTSATVRGRRPPHATPVSSVSLWCKASRARDHDRLHRLQASLHPRITAGGHDGRAHPCGERRSTAPPRRPRATVLRPRGGHTHADQPAVRELAALIEALDERVSTQVLVGARGPVLRALDAGGLFERAPRLDVQEARRLRSASLSATETVVALAGAAAAAGQMDSALHLLTPDVAWSRGRDPSTRGRAAVAALLREHAGGGHIAHAVEAQDMVLTGACSSDRGLRSRGSGHVLWTAGGQVVVGAERGPPRAVAAP